MSPYTTPRAASERVASCRRGDGRRRTRTGVSDAGGRVASVAGWGPGAVPAGEVPIGPRILMHVPLVFKDSELCPLPAPAGGATGPLPHERGAGGAPEAVLRRQQR